MGKLVLHLVFLYLVSIYLLEVKGYHHNHEKNEHSNHHRRRFVDLTHVIEEKMPVAKDISPPELDIVEQEEGFGLSSEYMDIIITEKVGTHINAPKTYNKAPTSFSVDEIHLKDLVNVPGVVIDLPAANDDQDRTVVLTSQKLIDWESEHGPIPLGAFVILRTGWNRFYNQEQKYFGQFEGEEKIMIPGFNSDSMEWLLKEREIVGVGTECFDIELPWKTSQAAKQMLSAANKYSIVQLNDVDLLPPRGFDLIIAPFKLKDGFGGAVRVFAVLHHNENSNNHGLFQHHSTHQAAHISFDTKFDETTSSTSETVFEKSDLFSLDEISNNEVEEIHVYAAKEYSNPSEVHHLSFILKVLFVIWITFQHG